MNCRELQQIAENRRIQSSAQLPRGLLQVCPQCDAMAQIYSPAIAAAWCFHDTIVLLAITNRNGESRQLYVAVTPSVWSPSTSSPTQNKSCSSSPKVSSHQYSRWQTLQLLLLRMSTKLTHGFLT